MRFSFIAALLVGLLISHPVLGADVEWRLMGPAFSNHLGSRGKLIAQQPGSKSVCNGLTYNKAVRIGGETFGPTGGLIVLGSGVNQALVQRLGANEYQYRIGDHAPVTVRTSDFLVVGDVGRVKYQGASINGFDQWDIQLAKAPVCHLESTPQLDKPWNELNSGIGIAKTVRSDEGVGETYYASSVLDSYGKKSLMLGYSKSWSVLNNPHVRIEPGYTTGIWWRSILNKERTSVDRVLLPYILPVLRVSDYRTGFGLDISMVPRTACCTVTTFMLQTSMRLNDIDSNAESLNFTAENKFFLISYRKTF